MAMDFVRKLFGDAASSLGGSLGDRAVSLLQLATPNVVGTEKPLVRILVGGITVVGAAVAGTIALSSFAVCIAALFALYYLLTEVLGLELAVDPRAFVAEAQRYAAQARAN